MISSSDNDLLWLCYDAEQELKLELMILDAKAKTITESADMVAINEAFKDAMLTYINKVVDGIQKAWNNFKEKGNIGDKIKQRLNAAQAQFKSNFRMRLPVDPPFEYPNLEQWEDINGKLTLQDMNQGTYNGMKQYLESEEDFIKHYYQQFLVGDNDIKESINQKVFPPNGSATIVIGNEATQFRDFLFTYPSQWKIIEDDLKKVNNSAKNVETMLSTIMATPAPTAEAMYVGNRLSYLLEDDNPASKFANADTGETTAPKGSGGEGGADRKYITTYFKASTKVISAKLATCNKIRNQALKICLNYIKLSGGATVKAAATGQTQTASAQTQGGTRGDRVGQVQL